MSPTHEEQGEKMADSSIQSSSALEDLKMARQHLRDLICDFEAIVLLERRCPALSEVREWRSAAEARLTDVGSRLVGLARSYAPETDGEEREGGEGDGREPGDEESSQ